MARIIGIDWGAKRTGIAVTDPLQIISSPLETVETKHVLAFLKNYCQEETVETFVVGEPMQLDGELGATTHLVQGFVAELQKLFPDIEIVMQDERFTSRDAMQIIRNSGLRKKQQHDKKRLDRISAALILEAFMEKKRNGLNFPPT
ncbi:MAG: hypothetical protein RL757_1303 [Bacteroidota bacterium]|jgi:putative Holliday junction resolvase